MVCATYCGRRMMTTLVMMMMMMITLLLYIGGGVIFAFSPTAPPVVTYRRKLPHQLPFCGSSSSSGGFCRHAIMSTTAPLTASSSASSSATDSVTTTGNSDGNNDNVGEDDDDLTKEELGKRFSEARDYYRKNPNIENNMSQENVCLSFLRTRLDNLRLNRCYVGPSTIGQHAGRGLFARRDILPGELVTLYPGDALLIWNTAVGDFGGGDVGVMFGPHVQGADRDASRVSTNAARSFELQVGPRHSIVADPQRTDNAAYLGHMINDGAILTQRDNQSRELYSKTTVARHNAAFFVMEGCHFVTVATKRIKKDEEIFVSYGEGYWLSRSYLLDDPGETLATGADAVGTRAVTKTAFTANSKKTTSKVAKQQKHPKNKAPKNGFGK
jgi:SET domain